MVGTDIASLCRYFRCSHLQHHPQVSLEVMRPTTSGAQPASDCSAACRRALPLALAFSSRTGRSGAVVGSAACCATTRRSNSSRAALVRTSCNHLAQRELCADQHALEHFPAQKHFLLQRSQGDTPIHRHCVKPWCLYVPWLLCHGYLRKQVGVSLQAISSTH